MYRWLYKDKWFHTTVTNVEPTAKQSWVLNPYICIPLLIPSICIYVLLQKCKGVYSIPELACSQGFPDEFQFYIVTGQKVKTVHYIVHIWLELF